MVMNYILIVLKLILMDRWKMKKEIKKDLDSYYNNNNSYNNLSFEKYYDYTEINNCILINVILKRQHFKVLI